MTFRIGQKIICVDADQAPMLTLNHIYTAKKYLSPSPCVWKGRSGSWPVVWLYEVEPLRHCVGFCAERFKPYDERKTDISVFKEMLNQGPNWKVSQDGTIFIWKQEEA